MPSSEMQLFNTVLCLLLDKHYHSRVGEWQSSSWSPYVELCRKQTFEIQVTKQYDGTIEKVYVHSNTTACTVARYCIHNADVTELGTVLGSPGSYELVWDTWTSFVRKFYRVEVSKFKPEYVTQRRNSNNNSPTTSSSR